MANPSGSSSSSSTHEINLNFDIDHLTERRVQKHILSKGEQLNYAIYRHHKEEAEFIYKELMEVRHGLMPPILPLFCVKGDSSMYLAIGAEGRIFGNPEKSDFFEKDLRISTESHYISNLYKRTIWCIFSIVVLLRETKIRCSLDISHLYYSRESKTATITKFEPREPDYDLDEEKNQLYSLLKAMNDRLRPSKPIRMEFTSLYGWLRTNSFTIIRFQTHQFFNTSYTIYFQITLTN
ncbi:hypothetical protein O6P43_013490 [Quillaja saponaria]|uniref:Uncharacterized protein n=1 Tax=Quillaja saponaria TaxID=32244 RepID=A0AAD7LSJ7_QUISA|nr:hypothetical protein O6P43_013490 [Quillaja saponaria]